MRQQTEGITKYRPAAVWARVSTQNQVETSLPSQISRCRQRLEELGFKAAYILSSEWSSMDLFACPDFQRLLNLIKNRQIEAVAVFDRDRLEATGLQRLIFLSQCREASTELIIVQGIPIMDEPEGQLIELALALAKEKQVIRARQGARDGLRDRAMRDRLPTSHHRLFGYAWGGKTEGEKQLSRELIPNEDWQTAKLIFELKMQGRSYDAIIKELAHRAIPSPARNTLWNKATLSAIIQNPAYAGRYYALKKQAVKPAKRRGDTYGNSSCRRLPLDESLWLKEVKIVKPPITWEQRGEILAQLEVNQKLSSRNTKRDYLLRGRILCGTHRGKKGEPRIYHGQPKRDTFYYVCPVGGCPQPYLNGPELESRAKRFIQHMLMHPGYATPAAWEYMSIGEKTAKAIRSELHRLESRYDRNINAQVTLEERSLLGQVQKDVYERLKAKLLAEQAWVNGRQHELTKQLAQIGQEREVAASLQELRAIFKNKLFTRLPQVSQEEWQRLIGILDLKIYVRQRTLRLDLGIPLFPQGGEAGKIGEIVLGDPGEVKHNLGVYRIYFTIPIVNLGVKTSSNY